MSSVCHCHCHLGSSHVAELAFLSPLSLCYVTCTCNCCHATAAPQHADIYLLSCHLRHARQVGCTTTSSSTAVLQKLLQLAAGDSSCTATTLAQDQGVALTPHDTAGQQQRQQEEGEGWRTAALEALQLFSFEELGEAVGFSGSV